MDVNEYRKYLLSKTIKVLKDHPPLSPIIRMLDLDGQKVIWKDYSERSCWVKDIWGKILISHECYILRRLAGIQGIPRLIKQADKYGFLSEYLEGEPLAHFKPDTLPIEVFKRFNQLVDRVHERGVVHLDLGQKRNILINKEYQPYFLDFANALYFRTEAFGFGQLFNLLCLIDRNALLKFKHRFFPHSLSNAEKQTLKRFLFIRRFWIFKLKKYRAKDNVLLSKVL